MKRTAGILLVGALAAVWGAVVLNHSGRETPAAAEDTRMRSSPTADAGPAPEGCVTASPLAAAALVAPQSGKSLSTDAGSSPSSFAAWLERLKEARQRGEALSPSFLEEGRRLAEDRRVLMAELIHENPWRALDQSLRWKDWAALPAEIQALVEAPFSAMADVDAVIQDYLTADGQGGSLTHRLDMHGTSYDAFDYGRRSTMTSQTGIPVQGITLDDQAALWQSPVMPLNNEDLAAVQERFPDGNPPGQSWLTGKPVRGDAVAALVGGRICYFASAEEMTVIAQAIAGGESMLGPRTVQAALAAATGSGVFDVQAFGAAAIAAQSAWTESPKRVLCMRLDYTPQLGTPFTYAEFMDCANQASNAIRTMSYGKTWLVPTVTTQVLVLPHSREDYEDPDNPNVRAPNDRTTVVRNLAEAAGYSLQDYDIFVESLPGSWAGVSSVGGSFMRLTSPVGPDVMTHELGHNYGVRHANRWLGSTGTGLLGHRQRPDGMEIEHEEYGDFYDIMGVSYSFSAWADRHMNVNLKVALNWIEPQEVVTAEADGIYRIYRFDHAAARTDPDAVLALCVHNRDGEEFWVSLREALPYASFQQSAYVVWTPDGPRSHDLIDTRPLSVPQGSGGAEREDSVLPVGASWTDPTDSFRITNLGAGGTPPFDYLDLEVAHLPEQAYFEFYTTAAATIPGLTASFVDGSLRSYGRQDDWRSSQRIVGTRIDPKLDFRSNGWGARVSVGLTHGTDANWDNFSVQWDGYLFVSRFARFATRSDDGSRMWIDLDGDGVFSASGPEFIDNNWGQGQSATRGPSSVTIWPGVYRIRIQYEDGSGDNHFLLVSSPVQFEFFADTALTGAGLTASFVDKSLRQYSRQDDWRATQTIAGTRVDEYPGFPASNWGDPAAVHLTHGTADNWNDFSVQWDGYVVVYEPMIFATASDDGSRMWIDLNGNGVFATSGPEFIDNNWGKGQSTTFSVNSGIVESAGYPIRIQYEDGTGDNNFMFYGAAATPSTGGL